MVLRFTGSPKISKDHSQVLLAYFLGLVTGGALLIVGMQLFHAASAPSPFSDNHSHERRLGQSSLINPLLDCDPQFENGSLSYLVGIETGLKKLIQRELDTKRADSVSVYFRDLNNGPVAAVNEDVPFRPGSLLKVPLAIGYMKRSETDPGILRQKITLKPELLKLYELQGIKPAVLLKPNQSYTLRQLIMAALMKSDNVAASMLESYDHHHSLRETAFDIDVPVHEGVPPYRQQTVQEYAEFFRILYNATYLNRDNSEQLLRWLVESDFKSGIAAGVPKNISVANKFGESPDPQGSGAYFSDCGIVYYPKRPYLLCVATRGNAQREQMLVVQEVSSWVYGRVDQAFR